MADYYPLIARAIAGLDPSAPGESRRALYERARAALIAQLRNQRRTRPLIQRTPALAGSTGVQAGDSTGNQRVVISHIYSSLRALR